MEKGRDKHRKFQEYLEVQGTSGWLYDRSFRAQSYGP